MVIMAIDPGLTGGIARLDTEAERMHRLTLYKPPVSADGSWDAWEVSQAIFAWGLGGAERFVVEQCHAFPGPQAYSSAKVMEGYGMLLAAIASRFKREDCLIVPANVWKKAMKITCPIVKAGAVATEDERKLAYKARKVLAVKTAEAEFGIPFTTPRGRLMDGEAEAALLALYGAKLWT